MMRQRHRPRSRRRWPHGAWVLGSSATPAVRGATAARAGGDARRGGRAEAALGAACRNAAGSGRSSPPRRPRLVAGGGGKSSHDRPEDRRIARRGPSAMPPRTTPRALTRGILPRLVAQAPLRRAVTFHEWRDAFRPVGALRAAPRPEPPPSLLPSSPSVAGAK